MWWGGIFIMIGNACLVFGHPQLFFCGLMVIVVGVGLLKPNISAIVAGLYPEGGSRRDAGFSIFYMGSISAPSSARGPSRSRAEFRLGHGLRTPCRWNGRWAWCNSHSRASISGLRGSQPAADATHARASWTPIVIGGALLVAGRGARHHGNREDESRWRSRIAATWVIFALAALYFIYLGFFAGLNRMNASAWW